MGALQSPHMDHGYALQPLSAIACVCSNNGGHLLLQLVVVSSYSCSVGWSRHVCCALRCNLCGRAIGGLHSAPNVPRLISALRPLYHLVQSINMSATTKDPFSVEQSPWKNIQRTTEFWGRATKIYAAYKITQLKATVLKLQGKSKDEIKQILWHSQHQWAGQQMYDLAVTLRGFYLKVRVRAMLWQPSCNGLQ